MSNADWTPDPPAFLLEGCTIDPLLDDSHFARMVDELACNQQIIICVTDLTFQDILAVPDRSRRERLKDAVDALSAEFADLPAVLVADESKRARPTYVGRICPVGQEDWECLLRLKLDERADARQALAAKWRGATLVTSDRKLVKRAMKEGISAITTAEWRILLENLYSTC